MFREVVTLPDAVKTKDCVANTVLNGYEDREAANTGAVWHETCSPWIADGHSNTDSWVLMVAISRYKAPT
jgi:hypothetical protein